MRRKLLNFVVAGLVLVSAGTASAGVCDLTTNGASCGPSVFTNQAIFMETSPQPTGTGYVDPFLRLQANGTEEGYNTSARPFELDQKNPLNYTHDLQLWQVPVKEIDGKEYREFFLDINESDKASKELLSLDELRIYLSPTGELDSYNSADKKLNGLTAIYDLDAGGDNWVKLNYSLNHGSGSGDMVVYIPNELFTGSSNQYLYLFSRFGDQAGYEAEADAGFEEWWVGPADRPNEITEVPEPATLVLFGTGLAVAARKRRKTNR